jgi:hypothetical protein
MKTKLIASILLAAAIGVMASTAQAQVCTPAHPCGDVNGSDSVTVADALAVLRRVVGMSSNLMCSCNGGEECPAGGVLRTGQVQCWNPLDTQTPIDPIDCPGTGQDGDTLRGLVPEWIDNGNGTVTDARTTLMWEKLSNDGTINDYDNFAYLWAGAFQKVRDMNDIAYAGYTDWRLPQIRELVSILSFEKNSPAVPAAFHEGCSPGCSVLGCSCTISNDYWSSTTYNNSPQSAWYVDFKTGSTSTGSKTGYKYVRAVRGGY